MVEITRANGRKFNPFQLNSYTVICDATNNFAYWHLISYMYPMMWKN